MSQSGIKFNSYFYPTSTTNSPTVLVLPGRSNNIEPYKEIAQKLNKSGFNVLLMNYNYGYHSSWNEKLAEKRGGTEGLVNNEVTAALSYLKSQKSVDSKRIGILGGSMGTWVGLQTMAKFTDLKSLVMLSPVCAVKGMSFQTYEGTSDLVKAFGNRNLFLIAAEKDRHSAKFPAAVEKSEYLISIMPNAKIKKQYYPGKSHSFFMLEDHMGLNDMIIQWFTETL